MLHVRTSPRTMTEAMRDDGLVEALGHTLALDGT
jgi:hypothetical protein